MKYKLFMLAIGVLLCALPLLAQEVEEAPPDSMVVGSVPAIPTPAPVTQLSGEDGKNDHGHAVMLSWELSADDRPGDTTSTVLSYEVFRWVPSMADTVEAVRLAYEEADAIMRSDDAPEGARDKRNDLRTRYFDLLEQYPEFYASYPENGNWKNIGASPSGSTTYEDQGSKERLASDYLPDFCDFRYRVDAVTAVATIRSSSEIFGPVQSSGQYFNTGRVPILIGVLVFGLLTLLFVQQARGGKDLYVRPLAGIEAVDDAIGRATEMGRPILYVLGLGSASDVATIASFTILGRVAKRVAEYQTELIVPTYDPIVMSVGQEVVRSAYLDAGRPDDYKEDTVYFVTQSQFAYVAAVNGTMLRELPATNVYMGKFFAESLLLAETGAVAGSIQIAGTDEIAQIPFFIVACDYTLIGEELYAASAYLGREPILLGSLKAQDWAKAAIIVFGTIGLLAANFNWTFFTELFRVTN
ncbi:MAG: hypothetical protein P1R58_06810 [bacterium]|nr:hypothetical protein [bacterium]